MEERARLTRLEGEIGRVLTRQSSLHELLQGSVEALVAHADAAFARVWTYNARTQTLELAVSAGLYTHLDGPHSRVPLGKFKIGLIASERQPHLTNQVVGDPRVGDQGWARREHMVAFAGYPLLVADELHGVLAMFSRAKLSDATFSALALVANTIALAVRQREADAERDQLLSETRAARDAAEAASRAKDEFIATVSHELRTPLNAILGWARLLGSDGMDAELGREAVSVIERNALVQSRLIEDLLDVSRIISGKLRLNLLHGRSARRGARGGAIGDAGSRGQGDARGHAPGPRCGSGVGGRRPAPAGRVEPRVQRGEIHAQGRPGAGAAGAGQFAGRVDGQRHGPGHRAGVLCRMFSSVSRRRTPPARGSIRGWAWVWASRAISSNCTAARWPFTAMARVRGRRSSCRCRS